MDEPTLFPQLVNNPDDVPCAGASDKTSVYRLFDRGGCLLYVGITSTGTKRVAQHRDDQPWFEEVSTASLEHYETRYEALRREAWAIRAEHPIYNKALNRWPGVHRCQGPAASVETTDLLALPHCCDWMRSRRQQMMDEQAALSAALASPKTMCGECRQQEIQYQASMAMVSELRRKFGG